LACWSQAGAPESSQAVCLGTQKMKQQGKRYTEQKPGLPFSVVGIDHINRCFAKGLQ